MAVQMNSSFCFKCTRSERSDPKSHKQADVWGGAGLGEVFLNMGTEATG